ncbi:BrxE family protein [Kaistella sp.]|uniref:BrxE family protein n=1 Tax=Kaistella sp. TaxID=2782235 RepID=UPI0035A0F2D6
MKEDVSIKINRLRLAVGYMIENKKWWNTEFFAPESRDFLTFIFPKSTKHGADHFVQALRFSTDNEVGSNYYHLFRLPIELEEQIYKTNSAEKVTIENEQQAVKLLKELSDGLNVENNTGPINIGSADHIGEDTVQTFAAQYYRAFLNNYQIHPYLN